jgi:metallo-beta-lactamase family protein
MRIKFHGPISEVTGSCYELCHEATDLHFLVDYGMKLGVFDAADWNDTPPPFDVAALDFVLLTHGHLDHCGLIPKLYQHGFSGAVICTRETAELAKINLLSACNHGTPYNREHVHAINWQEPPSPTLGHAHQLRADLTVTFRRTAHILGAVSLQLEWGPGGEERQLTFSGDIGNNTRGQEFQPLMRHRVDPPAPQTDRSYVVMESTYGGMHMPRMQKDFGVRLATLKKHVERTVRQKEGCLVIPCFAIGRTQSVLFDLHYLFATTPELRDVPVLFDARMARKVNSVYANSLRRTEEVDGVEQPMWLSEQLHRRMGLDSTSSDDTELLGELLAATFDPVFEMPEAAKDHRSEVIRNWKPLHTLTSSRNRLPSEVEGPSIVVTGGGMCDGGPVANYLTGLLDDERNTVLLTGYCSKKTNGGKLLRIAGESIKKRQKRRGQLTWSDATDSIPLAAIHADIDNIRGYSGHADHDGLLDWFFGWDNGRHYPAGMTVFLTHGNDHRRGPLADAIAERAQAFEHSQDWCACDLDIQCPDDSEAWFDFERDEWVSVAVARPRAKRRAVRTVVPAMV